MRCGGMGAGLAGGNGTVVGEAWRAEVGECVCVCVCVGGGGWSEWDGGWGWGLEGKP